MISPVPFRIATLLVLAGALIGVRGAESLEDQALREGFERDVKPLLATSCIGCHNTEKKKGGVNFAAFTSGGLAVGAPDLWKLSLAKIDAGEMPPDQEKRPSDLERRRLADWVKAMRHRQQPDPGDAVIRRLSRIEYRNTVRDLFGADLRIGLDLPPDSPGEGFDNAVSPLLMEKYLLAADEVLDALIMTDQVQRHYDPGALEAVRAGVPDPGRPDGKERVFDGPGEVSTIVDIPVEGSYSIRIKAGAEQSGQEPVRLGVRFDNQVVAELRVVARSKAPAVYTCKAQLAPGRTRFSIVFMNPLVDGGAPAVAKPGEGAKPRPGAPAAPRKPEAAAPAAPAVPAVRSVTIAGIDLTGPPAKAQTAAQKRIFVAVPGKDVGKREAAQRIAETFAYRAFRRPPLAGEIAMLLKVFDLSDAQGEEFADSIKLMLKAVLVSPQFLFRTPEDRPSIAFDGVVPVGDHDLATRLSYFLWATMPDDELLQLARDGKLHEKAVYEAQVRRLLKDPRSRALAETFAASWMGLDQFADAVVDPKKFPQMTPALREAMREEPLAFFENLMREGGSMLDLLDCDYAFMNGLTARLYGNDMVQGPKMQKVALTDRNRGGLIGMPAILMITSRSDRTSPVKRGKWVLQTFFDQAPPPPPPEVDTLEKQHTAATASLSLRQQIERHRTDAACAACHRIMDPLGFGLENFDAIGRWRTRDDTGGIVDAVGELPGKQRFSSPSELKGIVVGRKAEFVRMFAGKLLAFSLGRRLSGYDDVIVEDLAEGAVRDRHRLDELIVRIATSYPFVNRRPLH